MKEEPIAILLAEDDPAHLDAIRRALEAGDSDVRIQAADTLQAYRKAVADQPPDIAVMDLNLSDGQALEVLISPPEEGAFPILIMTSYGNERLAVEAMKSGAMDYIVKSPEAFADMPRTIERALREWNLLRECRRAEGALREDQEIWDHFLENSPIYVYFKDDKIRAVRLSRNFENMLGRPIDELLGKTMDELFPSDLAKSMVADDLRILKEGKQINIEEELNGRIYKSIKFPIHFGGKPRYLAGYTIDITDQKRAEVKLQESLEQLRRAVETTIQVLVLAVEAKDPYTAGHQRRMADLARAIATEMGLSSEKIEGIRMAGVVHDIGKISLPTEILSKPTKLSEIEFSLIKEHARQGYEILKDVESCWPLAEMVREHHERMDGSGYPRGLKREEIMVEARILAVADVVESMASHRPYRAALGIDAALAEIEKNSGLLYEGEVADACLKLFRGKGFAFS